MGWKTAFHYDDEEELFHSGYFYGKINDKNLLEGNNIAFVYPDFETALVGKFVDEVDNDEIKMISAKEAKIVAFKCQNGLVDLKIKSKSDSPIFKYDPPSLARISKNVSPNHLYFLMAHLSIKILFQRFIIRFCISITSLHFKIH